MGAVVVLGSINMDLVVKVPRLAAPGDTVLGERLLTVAGGKGANQAVAAARLGASVRMIGRVGDDAFGSELIAGLKDDGVDASGVAVDRSEPSGVALIVVDRAGENTVTVAPGANARVATRELAALRDGLVPEDVVVLQLEVPLEAVLAAVDAAHDVGARAVLNAAPSVRLMGQTIPYVDVLVVNERESADLGGPDVLRASQAVVETMGADGAMVYEGSTAGLVKPFHIDAVDTTAAGDAFVGAMAFALARGSSVFEAVRLGNAAGAAAATRLGARPSLPFPADLKRLFGVDLGNGAATGT